MLALACHVGDWDAVGEFITVVKERLSQLTPGQQRRNQSGSDRTR